MRKRFLLYTPAWKSQSWYPVLLQLTVRIRILLPKTQNLLLGPNTEKHPLIEQGNLQLLEWIVSGKDYMQKKFRKTLPLLSQMLEDQVQMLIINRSDISGTAGVLRDRLTPLSTL